ncbi:MAG: hypothetical protein Tsb0021_06660 [Chlamydiales bacterium]
MMNREFTATVYIFNSEGNVLLIHHPKYHVWIPPGGHVEPNETPVETAVREAYEETGLRIRFIPQDDLWIQSQDANSIERPFLCLLETIPATSKSPEHQHIDFIYIAQADPSTHTLVESHHARWFSLDEALNLKPEKEIFDDVLEVLHYLKDHPHKCGLEPVFSL